MKKRDKFLLLILVSSISIYSCNNIKEKKGKNISILKTDNKAIDIINVPADIFDNTIDVSKLIDKIDFTLLETKDECIIGQINKVLSDSNYYFIHDKNNKNVFRFNQDGKFLNKIGSQGKGPKEYIDTWDIALNKVSNSIDILDLGGRKIIRYSYDGTFIETSKLQFLYTQLEYGNDFMVLHTGKSYNEKSSVASYQLVISDLNQLPLFKAFPINTDNHHNYTTLNPLRKFEDRIFYHLPFHNSIWTINREDKSLSKLIALDFGKKGWSTEEIDNASNDDEIRRLQKKYHYFSGSYVISPTHQFYKIYAENKVAMLFQDAKSKHLIYGNKRKNFDKMLYSLLFNAPQWLGADNQFITVKQAYRIFPWKKEIFKNDFNKLTKKEKEKIELLKESDNPILVTFSLKNF